VLLTDQKHPSDRLLGAEGGQVRHEVRTVELPLPPESPAQLADIVISAIGQRTRDQSAASPAQRVSLCPSGKSARLLGRRASSRWWMAPT
jgi:hypothetical protein